MKFTLKESNMFRVRVDAQETYRSSIRPVLYASVQHLAQNFNMDKDALVYFNGQAEISRMIGTNFSTRSRTDLATDVGYHNRLFVTAERAPSGVNDELDSCHRWITNHPFWQDPLTKSMIVPMFVTRRYNMTINRYFKDRVTADQYRDHIQNVLTNPHVNTFNTIVHYPISYQMMECFEDIHKRLVNAGKVDPAVSAYEWFQRNALVPTDVITNLIGNNACFVFKRSLETISLYFGNVNLVEVQKGKYQGQYLASLDYHFYLSEHTRYELHYPIMVYQQMTNPLFIPETPNVYLDDYTPQQFYEAQMATRHKGLYEKYASPFMFVFPKEDNWRPPYWNWMDLQLQRLVSLEDEENQLVLNLFEFNGEDNFWDPTFKKYIKRFHKKVTKRLHNPMHIRIYSNDIPVEQSHVTMDEDGNIFLKHKPTMSATYRVCFYLDENVHLWLGNCVQDILEDEEYGRWIIGKILPEIPLPGDCLYPGVRKPGDFPWVDWYIDILNKVVKGKENYSNDTIVQFYMLEGLIIAKDIHEKYLSRQRMLDISMSKYLRRK